MNFNTLRANVIEWFENKEAERKDISNLAFLLLSTTVIMIMALVLRQLFPEEISLFIITPFKKEVMMGIALESFVIGVIITILSDFRWTLALYSFKFLFQIILKPYEVFLMAYRWHIFFSVIVSGISIVALNSFFIGLSIGLTLETINYFTLSRYFKKEPTC